MVRTGGRQDDGASATGRALPTLTGLRAVAALGVFGLHVSMGLRGDVHTAVFTIGASGGLGVSFFFMLSGTVLAWSTTTASRRRFWRARAARIYPVYLVVVLTAEWLSVHVSHSPPRYGVLVVSLLLLQAWVPNPNFFFGTDSVAWSLSCEAFFYVLAPSLIARVRRLSGPQLRAWALTCLLSSTGLELCVSPGFQHSHYSTNDTGYWLGYICPLGRLPEFILGLLLGEALRRGVRIQLPRGYPILMVASLSYICAKTGTLLSVSAITMAAFAATIVTAASCDLADRPSVFRSRRWSNLGNASYAFYLIHYVVIIELEQHLAFARQGGFAGVTYFVVALTTAWGLALGVHLVLEVPLQRILGPRSGSRLRTTAGPGAMAARRVVP